jgi:hypothetical protein
MHTKDFDPFYLRLYILLGGLVAICLLLGGLIWLQGPRIRLTAMDTTQVTRIAGQRLVLHTSQPLDEVTEKQVTVSPKTPISVMATGNTIIVTFAERLLHNTSYTVSIQTDGRKLTHKFSTAAPTFYYVQQDKNGDDEIRARTLGDTTEETVFAAPSINDYLVLDGVLLINTFSEQTSTNTLVRLDLDTMQKTPINLPDGTVGHLRDAPDKRFAGFSFTSMRPTDPTNKLHVYDIDSRTTTPVTGFGGAPLEVADWRFGPDNTTILAMLLDGNTVLADSGSKTLPTPLGQFTDIGGFSDDGKTVILEHAQGAFTLDLETGRQQSLETKKANAQTYLIDALPLRNRNGHMLHWHGFIQDHYAEYLVSWHDRKETKIYQTKKGQGILDVEQSPNGQYVALTTTELLGGIPEEKIVILEAGGKQVMQLTGKKVHWP